MLTIFGLFLLILVCIFAALFFNSSRLNKQKNKDLEKNPYDHRHNPPPPPPSGGGWL